MTRGSKGRVRRFSPPATPTCRHVLLSRVSEELMVHMLLYKNVFVALHNSAFLQVQRTKHTPTGSIYMTFSAVLVHPDRIYAPIRFLVFLSLISTDRPRSGRLPPQHHT